MNSRCAAFILFLSAIAAQAETMQAGRVELSCHRTANQDVPENTLESLEQAALMGCNLVEIDVRRTLDGRIVLNHDGFLERLTNGVGDPEKTYYEDLELLDAGAWMGERFESIKMPLLEDAVRLARDKDIQLYLDMKTKGMGTDVLEILQREGMLKRVRFGGEWEDVKQLYPGANVRDPEASVQPGVTAAQVAAYHREGKVVIANFSANGHEMDLQGMKDAVAAGVDMINVDYPRLGADAVNRPVERKLAMLTAKANKGDAPARADAILELSRYRGFSLQDDFSRWLLDPDDHVSRAAALALVKSRPRPPSSVFDAALRSDYPGVRANAAWALGVLGAPASKLLPLLKDRNLQVLQQALLAMSRMPGEVDADALLPILTHGDISVRGEAALALARHQPEVALKAIPAQFQVEMDIVKVPYDDYAKRGHPQLTDAEIDEFHAYFRCEIKMVQALSMLKGAGAAQALEEIAFRHRGDYAGTDEMVAAFQLWDRIAIDPEPAVLAMGSDSTLVADRAEWMLVQAGPAVLPQVRKALNSENLQVRQRAVRVVAWQGDRESVAALQAMQQTDAKDAELIAWAINKIQSLRAEP